MVTGNGSNEPYLSIHGNTTSTHMMSAHNEEQVAAIQAQANASTGIPEPQLSQHFHANDTTTENGEVSHQETTYDPPFLNRYVSLSEVSGYEDFYEEYTVSEESYYEDLDDYYDSYDSQASDYDSEFSEEQEEDLQRHSSVIAIGIPSVQQQETREEEEEERALEKERYKTPEEAALEKISVAVALDMAEAEYKVKQKLKDTSQYTMVARLPPAAELHASNFDENAKHRESLQDSGGHLKPRASLDESDGDAKRRAVLQESDRDLKLRGSLHDSDADLKRRASLKDSDTDLKHSEANIHEREADSEEESLEAQAGIPLVLPGAFAVEGIGASEGLVGQVSGYDSGFDNSDADTEEEFREETVVELEAELHPDYEQSQRMLLDGIALLDDELPAEQELKVPMKVRLTQGGILITALAAIGLIIGVTVSHPGGGSSNPGDVGTNNLVGWEQVGNSLRGTQIDKDGSYFGSAVSLSANGQRLVVNSPGWDESPSRLDIGQAIVYDWNGESWEQVGQELVGPGPRTTTTGSLSMGQSVALSKDGNRVAFGSPDWNGGQVTVWEHTNSTNAWTTVGQNLTGTAGENGRFGYAVALSSDGTVVTVGSPFAVTSGQEAIGVVRIFAESANSTWVQRGQDLVGEGEFELHGWSVALSANGSRVAIGSPGIGIGSFIGAIRAFEFNGTAWTPLGQMINGDSIQDKFGHSVSLSDDGTVLAVGGWEKPGPANSIYVGHVRVYKYTQDDWVQLGGDLVGTESYDNFGYSVSLSASGMQVAVGSPRSNSMSGGIPPRGSISVYEFDGAMWKRQQGMIGSLDDFDNLGYSVSLSAGRVAGGAPYASFDGRYNNVGMAGVYQPIGE